MADVTVPAVPPLGRIKGVEILHVGEWDISTGTTQVTLDDLHAMVAATGCPAVRNATLKPGHKRPLMQGDPSLGYVRNLRVEDDYMLIGDWCAMPGWLVERDDNGDSVIAGAYADRSAEWGPYVCQLGHTHPMVLGAVALLGVEHPGIGTLESLQDLYSTPPEPAAAAAAKEAADMPLPKAAAVSTTDVVRAYHADAPWAEWIEEIQLDPLQLIVVDDETGKHYRVPVAVSGDDFTFGDRTEVRVEYVDAAVQAAAVAAGRRVLFASRAESRPTSPRPDAPGPSVAAGGATTNQEGAGMDPAKLREALGLQADASDEQVSAALAENNLVPAPAPAEPTPKDPAPPAAASVPALPPGYVAVPAAAWEDTQAAAQRGASAAQKLHDQERERVIGAAKAAGKILLDDKSVKGWRDQFDRDPEGTTSYLATAPQLIPVGAAAVTGYTGGDDTTTNGLTSEDEAFLAGLSGGAV
jgi:hypothetical protein